MPIYRRWMSCRAGPAGGNAPLFLYILLLSFLLVEYCFYILQHQISLSISCVLGSNSVASHHHLAQQSSCLMKSLRTNDFSFFFFLSLRPASTSSERETCPVPNWWRSCFAWCEREREYWGYAQRATHRMGSYRWQDTRFCWGVLEKQSPSLPLHYLFSFSEATSSRHKQHGVAPSIIHFVSSQFHHKRFLTNDPSSLQKSLHRSCHAEWDNIKLNIYSFG